MFRVVFLGGGGIHPPPCIFVVSGPVTMKFCTGIDHQSVSSNMKKDLHKINCIIIVRPLSFVQKYTNQKNTRKADNAVINGHIMLTFCRGVAHETYRMNFRNLH